MSDPKPHCEEICLRRSGMIADTHGVRHHLWWILGLVLVSGGLAIAVSFRVASPTDFGWIAYTPLSDNSDWHMGWSDGSALIVSQWQLAGCAVTAIGMMVLVGGTGFRLGQRRAPLREKS